MKLVLKDICKEINTLNFLGDYDTIITNVKSIEDESIGSNTLLWCNDNNKKKLSNLTKGNCIVSLKTFQFIQSEKLEKKITWIIVEEPRLVFSKILKLFFVEAKQFGVIANSSFIHANVKYDKTKIKIGHNVVINKNVTLGDFVEIGANTVINDTIIEDNVKIGCNNTIGGTGFGYEKNEDGIPELIPHIGNVILKSNVEIGNNTCIDRAVLGSTIINQNVKIDNLVHIAHGVNIGKNSMVIANSMIAGSVIIGENVWISPSSSIIQKIEIGSNSLVGMGSVVLREIDKSVIVAGVPAKIIRKL